MDFDKNIESIAYQKKDFLLQEIDRLKKVLNITHEFKVSYEEIDSIFLKNLNLENSALNIAHQIQKNKDKDLIMHYKIGRKVIYIKSFGKIRTINKELLADIYHFLILIRLVKKLNESSYLATQYFRTKTLFNVE